MSMKISLIHGLRHSVDPIENAFGRLWPEARIMNLLDDTLASDLAREPVLTQKITDRFLTLTRYAVSCGAEGILFTCSAFGACIEACQAEFPSIPILKPNEAMIEDASSMGPRVGLMATFPPTLLSMPREFEEMAPRLELVPTLIEGALAALDARDPETHDRLAAETARRQLLDCDVIALSQFSLARAASAVAAATGKTVLTTPDSAVRKLKRILTR
jgi:hypothetical protein